MLVSAVLCCRVLETGSRAAAEGRGAAVLGLGLVGATGTGAVYESFLTTLVIGVDMENRDPIPPSCKRQNN